MNTFEQRLQQLASNSNSREATITPPPPTGSQKSPSSNSLPCSTLDVFTTTRFKGNQLAVIHVPSSLPLPASLLLSQETKQTIAREFNFSETVFLHDAVAGTSDRRLDIFTLKEELPFAGHPIIGTICHVCQSEVPPLESVTLLCKAGPIMGRYDPETKLAEAEIPHNVRIHQTPVSGRAVLKAQPYLSRTSVVTNELRVVSIVHGMSYVLIQVPSISPHLEKLEVGGPSVDCDSVKLDEGWTPSFIGTYFYAITSHSSDKVVRLRTRMLEPSVGEDSATGSAASTLASFLALKDGTAKMTFYYSIEQGVEMGRASEIQVKVTLDATGKAVEKVVLAGRAVRVTQGVLYLPESRTST
ncbi:MAG: hypothetical protein ALECFALPRED_003329 [Alectoria fallacina]|uniref:Uncharacterized protein n=1 Tax=Alectoria fallacina TaxID=1903189 RepID=A0A8H3ENT1_9LECA|nr:MAG: hypothetical protein ALECFALPRED_003329 [Alectoria fallacina]